MKKNYRYNLLIILFFILTGGINGFADTRILFLGDSITSGLGVETSETYPVIIEDMLKKRGSGMYLF